MAFRSLAHSKFLYVNIQVKIDITLHLQITMSGIYSNFCSSLKPKQRKNSLTKHSVRFRGARHYLSLSLKYPPLPPPEEDNMKPKAPNLNLISVFISLVLGFHLTGCSRGFSPLSARQETLWVREWVPSASSSAVTFLSHLGGPCH